MNKLRPLGLFCAAFLLAVFGACNAGGSELVEMAQIPAGTLTWGSATITLTAFKIGKYEVTQEQYQTVMGINPSSFSSNPAKGEIQGKRPVEMVTWFDAIEFCNKLSEREGLIPVYTITERVPETGYPIEDAAITPNWTNNGYRLPTEAQWEYACRAGKTSDWHFGDDKSNLKNYAWYDENSDNMTHQVGKKLHNEWGLYDMYGNVWEWCWDWLGALPSGNQTDYKGEVFGSDRVGRGGCSWGDAYYTHSADRGNGYPSSRGSNAGFRVVRH